MNKVAVISGASRGIGFAIAEVFAKAGFDIAICSRNPDRLAEAKKGLEGHGCKVLAMATDMSKKEEVHQFADAITKEYPSVDVLVNNAGSFVPGNIHELEIEDLESQIATNLYSAFFLSNALIPRMKEKGSGFIATISSVAGLEAYLGGGAYSVSKFALTGFIKSLRLELKDFGIRVCGVYPGAVLTDSWAGTDLPKERFMKAEDIANAVFHAFQLSPQTVIEDLILRPQKGDI